MFTLNIFICVYMHIYTSSTLRKQKLFFWWLLIYLRMIYMFNVTWNKRKQRP